MSLKFYTLELPAELPHDTASLVKRLAAGPHGARPFTTTKRKARKPAPIAEDLFAGGHTPLDLVELAAKGH